MVFLHIPKAAGTTLRKIIERQYEPDDILTTGDPWREWIKEFARRPQAQKAEIKIFLGHLRFGFHTHLPQPSTYFTMLRDPVDRIVSYYYFVLESPAHYLYDIVTSQNMTLKDLLCSEISTEFDNGQTRSISGIGHKIGFGQCSPETLESAQANLRDHFAVVGLTEHFDESLLLLKRAFGWRTPFYVKENVTKNRPRREEISKDTLNLIAKYNQLDIELYRYAQRMFDELVSQHGPSFKKEVATFKLLNKHYSRIYSFSRSVKQGVKTLFQDQAPMSSPISSARARAK